MKAILVIQTANGYAVAPYTGPVPSGFVETMKIATEIKSYSYGENNVAIILRDFFEPKQPELTEAPAPAPMAVEEA